MLPLNRLLQEGLRRYHLEQGVKARKSVTLWERVAGPTVAAVTQADGIRDGILYVFTHSSAWSQELSLLKEPIIARINAELESDVVTDVRFQVRRFKKPAAAEEAVAPTTRQLSSEERAAVRALSTRLQGELADRGDLADRIATVAEKQMLSHAAGRACPGCGGPLRGEESHCPFCRER